MTRPSRSLPPAYFEAKYAADPDPWRFASSAYEAAKYEATLAALPRPTYRVTLELGCSIGVLTERLAARSETMLALDVAEDALRQAHERCRDLRHVRLERRRVPDQFPDGRFDLVLVSEVGYYLSRDDWIGTIDRIRQALEPGGHLLLVHWTPEATDYPLTGDQVHRIALTASGFRRVAGRREATWRLDLLERAGP